MVWAPEIEELYRVLALGHLVQQLETNSDAYSAKMRLEIPYVLYVRTENRKSSKNHGIRSKATADYITYQIKKHTKRFRHARSIQTLQKQKIYQN